MLNGCYSRYTGQRTAPEILFLVVGLVGRRQCICLICTISVINKPSKMQATLYAFIVNEAQRGDGMNVKNLEQQGMEPAGLFVQGGRSLSRLGPQNGEVDLGVRVVWGQINARKRNQAHSRYVDFALDDNGQILLYLVGKPEVPACVLSSLVSSHDA